MKKLLLFSTLIFITCFTTLISQNVNIPDPTFKSLLVGTAIINTNSDTEIQVSEAMAFTGTISCHSQFISDLTGIEAFVNITELQCQNNLLTNLDLSYNTSLNSIRCNNNQLVSLNLANGNNLSLWQVWANNNNSLTCIQIDAADTTGYNWIGGLFQFDSGVNFTNNCGTSSILSENKVENFITIYPNPTNNQVNLSSYANYQLNSVEGQIIKEGKNVNMIDFSDQPNGIYLLTLTDNIGNIIQKNRIVKK